MKESRVRRKLAEKLDAEVVTSCDQGGHRRFKSRKTGKWGYCTNEGTIVQAPRFDSASHFNGAMNTYNVVEGDRERYYDPDWSNSWSTEQYVGSRAF
jgi:hypothetical protein